MENQYAYILRPGYKSEKLLIEFTGVYDVDALVEKIMEILVIHRFIFDGMEDLWMNDEFLTYFKSENRTVEISKNTWGFVFIMSDHNQKYILIIDKILQESVAFRKEEVDFSKYK